MNPIENSLSTQSVYTNILLNSMESNNNCSCSSGMGMIFTSVLSSLAEQEIKNSIINETYMSQGMNQTINDLTTIKDIEISTDNKDTNNEIEKAVKEASKKYNIDENLLKAVIKTESNFNKDAVSHAGAKGLMQIMPSNFKHLGIKDPFDISQNINGGAKLLREYLNRFDQDIEMALMAYNGGPTRMNSRGVESIDDIYKMPKETQNYVVKVMNEYKGN